MPFIIKRVVFQSGRYKSGINAGKLLQLANALAI